MNEQIMDSSYKKLVTDLSEAIKQQKLVIFVGAGVSISQGYPNWNNYVDHLIKYWQGQVLAESKNRNIGIEQIKIFDLILSKSDISNKRKVELVNQELKIIFENDFENRRLDFEKAYFKNLLPYSTVNPTLQHLASLNAILITSNYDYEIENHFKLLKNTVKTVNDLNEFQKIKKGNLFPGDILHIHGTPDCDVKYFVSSSADYSQTYLRNRKNYNDLVKWFKNTRPTIFEKILTVDPNKLSTLRDDNKRLNMFHFINSELGSYLQCLISLINNHSEYSRKVVQKVDTIKDSNYKEIIQGVLINEYDDTTKIAITYYTFLGYSYSHTSVTSEAARIFTDVIRQLLNKKIEDNQILDRVFMIALECINPTEETFELSQNNFAIMINIIFTEEHEFQFSEQWLLELFNHNSTVNYLETISNLLYRENVNHNRLSEFIEELKNLVSRYKYKLSSLRINYLLKQGSPK